MQPIHVIDSHTAGEPTRTVISGGPDLGTGTVLQQREVFSQRFDHYRSAIVNEPRGSDVLVGALLCPPSDPRCVSGVIFFNNVGTLGMCGHGTIGVIASLAWQGRIQPGEHLLETPVGVVRTTLHADGSVSLANVPSWREATDVRVDVPGLGMITGDVAWGGNWFFLVSDHGRELRLEHVDELTDVAWRIRQAINAAGYPLIDHVELFGPPGRPEAHSRNFVLCPGKAYDRSPCGTGTSAELACLAAAGKLAPAQMWRQESILGTEFTGSFEWLDQASGKIIPTITGTAYVNSEARLILDERDPFQWGIRRTDA